MSHVLVTSSHIHIRLQTIFNGSLWTRLIWQSLILLCLFWLGFIVASTPARADDSTYNQNSGFFVLADHSYSSHESAQIRLELQSPSDVQAIHQFGGVEVAVYQVTNPIGFLQAQTNLHRINIQAVPAQSGLWNSVVAIWDRVMRETRLLWRSLFAEDVRQSMVTAAPDLHEDAHALGNHRWRAESNYQPLHGLTPISRFRYPVQFAKDIPPAAAALEGANVSDTPDQTSDASGTTSTPATYSNGNVYIPLGRLASGLYVTEVMLGNQRAVAMVFVSDTVAVNKINASSLLVWTVNRTTGAPVADVDVHWNDGTADLVNGHSNTQGLVQLNHAAPDKTYVYARDPQGGVLISENFYYDSEIYNRKLYATTDRPLYHAGDTVQVKIVGREFINARDSKPLTDAPVQLNVIDPNGLPVASTSLQFNGQAGGQTSIKLPANSIAGGYEIQFSYLDEQYSAAFRVADYQKPHFEINFVIDHDALKTGKEIPVKAQLRYPDGKPVKHAQLDLDLKAQALSMVEGDLGFGGLFPIKLSSQQYTTDGDGNITMKLPAVKEPSRYVISVLVTDGAAYRVRHTQELLIERAEATWHLQTATRFSDVGQPIQVTMQQVNNINTTAPTTQPPLPVQWKMQRLEDRSEVTGRINNHQFTVTPTQSGSYTISLLAADGSILGATSHWVTGTGLQAASGHIEIVWDKDRYQVGNVANGLITFSEPVNDALITLERDQVEATGLLSQSANWMKAERLSPQQWRVHVPVTENFAPNLTFSVAYVQHDQFLFENAGIVVSSPQVNVAIHADKATYAPGETVHLNLQTTVNGKPVPANVSLGVVDEMIYVLQPEIAPDIHEFFYHPRRNNVRTQYSGSFIGYDLSNNALQQPAISHDTHQRVIKVLERPRRDDVDTAYWAPQLSTDQRGVAEISFTMPDALSRWRITARAMTADGTVGQSIEHIVSSKDLYAKWTSPLWLRPNDTAVASLALFNQTNQPQSVQLSLQGAINLHQNQTLQPGINFVDVPRTGQQVGNVIVTLSQNGVQRDRLQVMLTNIGQGRLTYYTRLVNSVNHQLTLGLPADASNIRLRWLDRPSAALYGVMDDLVEQPFGCAEQTASRMIPLSLAYRALPKDDPRRATMSENLYTQRLRLASMAGDESKFGWWGSLMPADPFITVYAYYADWWTAQTLGINLPDEHWQSLLDVYSNGGISDTDWKRALMLDWMHQIGLPVGSMVSALAQQEVNSPTLASTSYGIHDSLILNLPSAQTQDMALVLTQTLLTATQQLIPAQFADKANAAMSRLQAQHTLLGMALLQRAGKITDNNTINDLLTTSASGNDATIDRAVMLTWLTQSLTAQPQAPTPLLPAPWSRQNSLFGTTNDVWTNHASLPTTVTSDNSAVISYDSSTYSLKPQALSASLTHDLYLLTPQHDGSFEAKRVDNGKVTTDALYLDSYTLTPQQKLRYMVIEAPLPSGAQVEAGTWGVKIGDQEMSRANYQDIKGAYVVPLGDVSQAVTMQHLLRFSQRGHYRLAAARAYDMYRPDAQVLAQGDSNDVIVR